MAARAILLAHRLVFEGGGTLSPESINHIRRNLASLAELGVTDICVVDGEQATALAEILDDEQFAHVNITVLANASWRHGTGADLLVARDFLCEEDTPCLVVHCAKVVDRSALAALATARLGPYDAVLAVHPASEEKLHHAIGVRLRRVGRPGSSAEISMVGYDLEGADAMSAGHALVSPRIISCLEHLPNPELEDGIAELIQRGGLVRAENCDAVESIADDSHQLTEKVSALLDAKSHPRYHLFNPGPVNTTPRVKSAMVHHDVCHRDSNFSELMVSLTGKLRRIFRASQQHTVCLVTGSGTAAMECAISSVVPRDGKILIVDNGAFGERLHEVASLHEMNIVHLRYAWGDEVQAADVQQAFEDHPDIAVVAMVHHETSVGLLNPVGEIGAIVRRHDALLIVDAVSSLGAEELDVVRDNIDVCYGSANKCLHAISGAGFLSVAPRVWQKIEHIRPRSYYLDLKRYRRYVEDKAQTPFTPAVSTYFALDAACAEFLADGHLARWSMYRRRNTLLRDGLAKLGMAPFTRTGRESNSVVTACVPTGVEFADLYNALKARGYIIYGCKDVLADRFLQVANMGDLPEDEIRNFLDIVAEVLAELRVVSSTRRSA
jgi:2-aminoethylphosphonate-pyruvate transaminase